MDLFSEVFSNLKTDNDLKAYLSDATIKRISTNRDRDSMRIYLHFNTLVPKSRIWKLEEEIRKQYFSKGDVSVRIIESFSLSEAYDAARLFEVYKDSILEEIYRYNKVMFGIIKKSDITFPSNDRILVTLEDSVVARKMEEDIHNVLFKIFCERCGKQTIIDFEYKEASEGKYRKRSEKAIEDIISSIEKNIRTAETMEKALSEDDKTIKSESDFDPKKHVRRKREPESSVSADPSVLYGKPFDGAFADICDIDREIQEVVLRGQILSLESREIKNEKVIVMFVVTDFTDSIKVKIFMPKEDLEPITEKGLKVGKFVSIKGKAAFDDFDKELTITSVRGVMKTDDFSNSRTDNAEEKRVELHCHTKMSDMDGVSAVTDIIGQAMKWGHKAIAITDHGAVQAFPDAFHKVGDSHDFKVIYGVEGYLVDDEKPIVKHSKDQSIDSDFVVFDIETTGFSADKEKIIEIGAVKIREGKIVDRFSEFVNPERPIPFRITELTSIRDEMVMDAEPIEAVLPRFLEFSKGCIMVAHNADFDMGFIKVNSLKQGLSCPETYVDTVSLSRFLLPELNSYKLDHVAKALSVSLEHHHRAVDDAECTALFFEKEIAMLRERNILTLDAVNEAGKMDAKTIMKLPTNHIIILAKNDIGRINLYRLISLSHVTYFHKKPRMPRSLIRKYREGLIIASACSAGELYSAVMDGKPDDELEAIASFYDYLEIQPVGNNAYMIESDKSSVNTVEDLQEHNRKIVALGEKLNKPVVATCDVHFLNPEDEVYRRIIQAGLKFDDADSQAPLYLHTTEEMLEEFSYLGEEKAYEVVVKNSNLIADMCDFIDPVRPDKCPPVIPDSDKTLRKICYTKAHQIYGEELPEIVSARLERELNSIISNGYAVMYIIAQKLVWKSNEDGYLVGSRGSVGSSFVATMAGITEVNPLSPHYICPECHYVDFDSDEVKAFAGRAGCDMPDKDCPVCGHKLNKDGFDIPFETFLGFKGNKEPDIDLNFSNEYQSKAHKYTEVIFGDGQTFKAGTIGTLADKTAYGFVMKYMEEKGKTKRRCEVDRIVSGCTGVRRTTGQHPGGIIVLPVGEDINTFTPVQHPANDMECGIVTTHFDYHSIDSNLLKLDILGHLDPTMIRKLEDLTGIDATQIPLDDKGVMSLFQDTSALKLTPDQLWKNCDLGTLGVPEFGTDFAMGMLRDTKPKEFSDLVRIAGLAHGTDVWLGNAETLIKEGKATISTAICTRDDIMTYLIGMGLDSEESFKIMEAVRKGQVAKGKVKDKWEVWKKDMIDHNVPDWYIWSCERIQYMFPKAHAAAYVMMAWRVAYCKVYYPLAYYAAFFSIRADSFNYEYMCRGKDVLEAKLKEIDEKGDSATAKDQSMYKDMRVVQEMYARGFEFLPIDLYRSDARSFQIVDGKLLPPFTSIEGMGDTAAETLCIAASKGKFLSKEDMRNRGKVSKTIADKMDELGILGDMSEENQMSLFDLK